MALDALPRKKDPSKNTTPYASQTLSQTVHTEGSTTQVRRIKRWFVFACCEENRNMFEFRLCKDSVTTAVTLLFEWHLCHVAACLQHELSSTEEKLF